MRFVIFTILVLILFTTGIPAQNTKEPPKSVAVTKRSEYISEEGGFKVLFPSTPKRTASTFDAAFGKASFVNFVLPTTLAYYSVGYMDFPTAIKDEKELRARYDSVKNKLLGTENIKLTAETEIYFGEHLGREFVYEKDNSTYSIRCFIIEQRFFQLSIGTRGSLINSTEKVKNYNKNLIEKFFNSFEITNLPEPKSSAVELPENFDISLENSVFKSGFFNLTIELPENWQITQQEENDVIKDLIKDSAKKDSPRNSNAVELSLQNSQILLMMNKLPTDETKIGAVFGIAAERVAFPNFLPGAITDGFQKLFLSASEKIVKTTTLEKIGGVELAWIEIYDSEANYSKRLYVTNRKGIALEFVMTYQDPKDLVTMLRALQSIKFVE